jgi:hypothetical protein
MKRSFGLMLAAGFLFAMFFSCSNDGFEAKSQENVFCLVADNRCSKISKSLCEEIGGLEVLSCNTGLVDPSSSGCSDSSGSLDPVITGDYENIPDFTCKWNPGTVVIGDSAALSLVMEPEDPNCVPRVFYVGDDTVNIKLDSNIVILDSSFSRLAIQGSLFCEDAKTGKEGSRSNVLCEPLKMDTVSSPKVEGKLTLNANYEGIYYYIGTVPSIEDSTIAIENKELARCAGEVKYDLSVVGDTVKAVATALCNGVEKELKKAIATVVPNPALSECVWDSAAIVMYDGTTPITHENLTLKVNAELKNNYGRCGTIEYSFDGVAYAADSTFSLETSANKSLTASARVNCITEIRTCPAVFVAYHVERIGVCTDQDRAQFDIRNGRTIFEFACPTLKDDYYFACTYSPTGQFTIYVEEGSVVQNGGDLNGWNFIGLDPISKDGLYYYPTPALVKTSVAGGLKCGIW